MSYIFWKLLPRPSTPDPTNTHSTRPQPIHLVPQLSYSPLKFENHQFPAIVNHTMSSIFWKQLPRPVQLTKNPFNSSLVGVRSLTLQLDKDPFSTSCFASLFLMWSHLLRCTSRTALMSGWHASVCHPTWRRRWEMKQLGEPVFPLDPSPQLAGCSKSSVCDFYEE